MDEEPRTSSVGSSVSLAAHAAIWLVLFTLCFHQISTADYMAWAFRDDRGEPLLFWLPVASLVLVLIAILFLISHFLGSLIPELLTAARGTPDSEGADSGKPGVVAEALTLLVPSERPVHPTYYRLAASMRALALAFGLKVIGAISQLYFFLDERDLGP